MIKIFLVLALLCPAIFAAQYQRQRIAIDPCKTVR